MARISNEKLRTIAVRLRPHITPLIEDKGSITSTEIKELVKEHASDLPQVSSERSLQMIDNYLTEL